MYLAEMTLEEAEAAISAEWPEETYAACPFGAPGGALVPAAEAYSLADALGEEGADDGPLGSEAVGILLRMEPTVDSIEESVTELLDAADQLEETAKMIGDRASRMEAVLSYHTTGGVTRDARGVGLAAIGGLPLETAVEDLPLGAATEDPPLETATEDLPLGTAAEDPPETAAEDPPPEAAVEGFSLEAAVEGSRREAAAGAHEPGCRLEAMADLLAAAGAMSDRMARIERGVSLWDTWGVSGPPGLAGRPERESSPGEEGAGRGDRSPGRPFGTRRDPAEAYKAPRGRGETDLEALMQSLGESAAVYYEPGPAGFEAVEILRRMEARVDAIEESVAGVRSVVDRLLAGAGRTGARMARMEAALEELCTGLEDIAAEAAV